MSATVDNVITKICSKCNNEKSLSDFNKDCTRKDGLYHTCKECRKIIRHHNKDSIKNRSKRYYEDNKDALLLKNKEYRQNNKKILKEKHHKYYIKHKTKIVNNNVNYERNKLKTTPNLRIIKNLRRRIYGALKHNHKTSTTINLIGCDINTLKRHLQNTAIENGYNNFNIENYSGSEYHIDHIIPCSHFDLTDPEQQKICFNYTNLQILTSEENLIKGNSIIT